MSLNNLLSKNEDWPFLVAEYFKKAFGEHLVLITRKHTETFKGSKHFTLSILFSFSLTVLIVKAVENLT